MAGTGLRKRLEALEGSTSGYHGPAIWVVCKDGETTEQAIERYEAEHGPRLPDQLAVVWCPVDVPSREAPCA